MAQIGLDKKEDQGRNVIARLKANEDFSTESVMVGGHIDHLGFGNRGGTRAKGEQASKMHLGADDNASGIAAIMELAQFMGPKEKRRTQPEEGYYFWSLVGRRNGAFWIKTFY